METRLPLLPLLKRYVERDPQTAAQILQTIDEAEAVSVLKVLPPQVAAQVFPHLQTTTASELLKSVPQTTFADIVKRMKPEQATNILINLSQDLRESLLNLLPEEKRKQIQDLLIYPENSAGRIMSTAVVALNEKTKVKDAVQKIRSLANRQAPPTYAYVIGEESRLVGILNMRDLLIAQTEVPLESIMRKDVFTIDGFMDREEVAQQLLKKHYFAAPVVNSQKHLIGIVKTDQLIGHVREEATEDILRMVGVDSDERVLSPIGFSLKKRLPWLHVNLVTAFLAAAVVALFENTIAKITVLAIFLPVVAGQGGNAGAQSLAVVMRGLVLREIQPSTAWKIVFKETWMGTLNGIIIGSVTAVIAWLWNGNPFLGIVIGLAMIVNLTAAGLSGAAIPLIMKSLGWDPAQSSSIIMTTVTDVVGFFAFLGFATLFQNHLL